MATLAALRIPRSLTRPTWSFDYRRGVMPYGSTCIGRTGRTQYLPNGLLEWAGLKDCATVVGGYDPLALPTGPVDTIDFDRHTNRGLNGTLESVAYHKGEQSDALIQSVSR